MSLHVFQHRPDYCTILMAKLPVAHVIRKKRRWRWSDADYISQPFSSLRLAVKDFEEWSLSLRPGPSKSKWIDSRCAFCKARVLTDPYKSHGGTCICGAKKFLRAAKDPRYAEEGWRLNGKEWVMA